MQEQPQYNMTPDQGWSKMSPVLDQVMPVNRHSRRFGFFWWTASALLTTGVVGLFVFKGIDFFTSHPTEVISNEKTSINGDIKTSETKNEFSPIQSENQKTESPIKINESNVNQQQKVEYHKPSTIKSSPASPSKSKSPSGANKKVKVAEPMAIADQKPIESGDQIITDESSLLMGLYTISNEEHVEATPVKLNSIDLATNISLRDGKVVSCVPLANSALESSSVIPLMNISPNPISKAKKPYSLIEPNLAISAMTGQDGGVGTFAGAGVEIHANRKLSFTTAVGYRSFNPTASLLGSREADLAQNEQYNAILNYDPIYAGIYVYVDGANVNSTTEYNVINPLVESVHQWQVSGGVKWNFTKRFFIESGIHLGLGTRATSQYPIVSVDPVAGITNAKIGSNLNDYDVVRSTMTSIYGGLGYQFGNHLDVFTQWTHGLDQYLLNESEPPSSSLDVNADNRTDYIRGLNLGLRYTL